MSSTRGSQYYVGIFNQSRQEGKRASELDMEKDYMH